MTELAEYLLKENYSTFAQSTLQKVSNRTNLRYLSCQAQLLQQSQQYQEAVQVYEQIIEQDSTSLNCYAEAGHSHHKLGNFTAALNFY